MIWGYPNLRKPPCVCVGLPVFGGGLGGVVRGKVLFFFEIGAQILQNRGVESLFLRKASPRGMLTAAGFSLWSSKSVAGPRTPTILTKTASRARNAQALRKKTAYRFDVLNANFRPTPSTDNRPFLVDGVVIHSCNLNLKNKPSRN